MRCLVFRRRYVWRVPGLFFIAMSLLTDGVATASAQTAGVEAKLVAIVSEADCPILLMSEVTSAALVGTRLDTLMDNIATLAPKQAHLRLFGISTGQAPGMPLEISLGLIGQDGRLTYSKHVASIEARMDQSDSVLDVSKVLADLGSMRQRSETVTLIVRVVVKIPLTTSQIPAGELRGAELSIF